MTKFIDVRVPGPTNSSRFGITLQAGKPLLYVEPAVNRQPGFRRELVEQITLFKIPHWIIFLIELFSNSWFPDSGTFLQKIYENSEFSLFFNILTKRHTKC